METWKHIRAVLLLPFMVTVVVPSVIVYLGGTDTLGLWASVPATRIALPVIGAAVTVLGLTLMVATIRLFECAFQDVTDMSFLTPAVFLEATLKLDKSKLLRSSHHFFHPAMRSSLPPG